MAETSEKKPRARKDCVFCGIIEGTCPATFVYQVTFCTPFLSLKTILRNDEVKLLLVN